MRPSSSWMLIAMMAVLAALPCVADADDALPPAGAGEQPAQIPEPPVPRAAPLTQAGQSSPTADALTKFNCVDEYVLCLDREGQVFPGERKPASLAVGMTLVVRVLSSNKADKPKNFELVVTTTATVDHLTSTMIEHKSGSGTSSAIDFEVVAEQSSGLLTSGMRRVHVVARRKTDSDPITVLAEHAEVIDVARGRYFVEFGLAVPFTYRGSREVIGSATVVEDTRPSAALSAIVFPSGQAEGEIERSGWHMIGVQIGTDFDFTAAPWKKKYYLGAVVEPIAGIGIGVGVALLPGQYLPPGEVVPDGGGESPRSLDRYMLRPYFAVHLTSEFLASARAAATALGK